MANGKGFLSFSTSESAPLQIQVDLTRPFVYLDYCIVVDLSSKNSEHSRQFCEIIESANGTLFISWAHIVELFALGNGPTFKRTTEYLSSFGGRFAIIDAHPTAVMRREREWRPGLQNPALDEEFTRLLGTLWDGRSTLSLAILFEGMAADPEIFNQIKALHRQQKADLKSLFKGERQKIKDNKELKNKLVSLAVIREFRPRLQQRLSYERRVHEPIFRKLLLAKRKAVSDTGYGLPAGHFSNVLPIFIVLAVFEVRASCVDGSSGTPWSWTVQDL